MGKRRVHNITSAEVEEAWQNAEAALKSAREIPGGAERIEALKQAGRLRLQADNLRHAAWPSANCNSRGLAASDEL